MLAWELPKTRSRDQAGDEAGEAMLRVAVLVRSQKFPKCWSCHRIDYEAGGWLPRHGLSVSAVNEKGGKVTLLEGHRWYLMRYLQHLKRRR